MAECPDYREIAENFYTAEEAEDVKMKDRICFPVLGGERGICKGAWNWIRKRNGFLLCQKRENLQKKDKKDQTGFCIRSGSKDMLRMWRRIRKETDKMV